MSEAETPAGSPARLDQLLSQSAAAHPERTAIVEGPNRLTCAEFVAAVGRTTNLLRDRGLQTGESVTLDALHGTEFVICHYAIHRAGCLVVGLNAFIGSAFLTERLIDSEAAALV